MDITIKDACPDAQSLIERVMREGDSLDSEYPLVFREEMPGRLVSVEEKGCVRSACAILARDLMMPTAKLRAGMIGSVSTDPDHRRQGLASRLLDAAEDGLREEGCLFALLWADDPIFYEKRGYQPIGCEVDFVLKSNLLSKLPPSGETVRPATDFDAESIHGLYAHHAVRVERSTAETRALLNAPGMEVLVHENAGQIMAYTCFGRGRDMQDVVHEWAGKPEDIGRCLHATMRRRAMKGAKNDLFLIAPPCEQELSRYLTKLGAESKQGVLGMAKLLDLRALGDLLGWFMGPDGNVRIDMRPAQLEGGGAGLRIQGPNMALLIGAQEAFRLLFSPGGDRTEVEYLERALGLSLKELPLKPFVWGLDSI